MHDYQALYRLECLLTDTGYLEYVFYTGERAVCRPVLDNRLSPSGPDSRQRLQVLSGSRVKVYKAA